ncbi:SMI1 / KNR4 family protein [Posidoniimonas polymericola]|uniref:SMI1 / KNR4 family protein n=1 Tax=Posidoniimonas polymericola TaxID=2528002 RepID=A0A5C5YMV5_9BACT|nr:SMI1/KNR4 family protein [Posidoniimonas polymericola]TWT76170.1 SMI1 / KNR4 family protein [Posidoniimonas polymericola]
MEFDMARRRVPISESEVNNLELQLDCQLPSEYKDFLSCHNGGLPARNVFAIGSDTDYWVDWLCWVDNNLAKPSEFADHESLAFTLFKYAGLVPDDTLAIGRCCRDDLLLLRIAGNEKGQIEYKEIAGLLGASRVKKEAMRNEGITVLAPDFAEFFDSLMLPRL